MTCTWMNWYEIKSKEVNDWNEMEIKYHEIRWTGMHAWIEMHMNMKWHGHEITLKWKWMDMKWYVVSEWMKWFEN